MVLTLRVLGFVRYHIDTVKESYLVFKKHENRSSITIKKMQIILGVLRGILREIWRERTFLYLGIMIIRNNDF